VLQHPVKLEDNRSQQESQVLLSDTPRQSILIIAGSRSTNPKGLARSLARTVEGTAFGLGVPSQWLELSAHELPLCAGGESAEHPAAKQLTNTIRLAPAVLVVAPVYNYTFNAATKNLIELTGAAWADKVVGILCTAGGRSSYMAPLSLANSLMLDFGCLIIPRFVYATADDFDAHRSASPDLQRRVRELVERTAKLAQSLASDRRPQGEKP
jgi:FMN reductase